MRKLTRNESFLRSLYRNSTGQIAIWCAQDKSTRFFDATDTAGAFRYARQRSDQGLDVYLSSNAMRSGIEAGKRGTDEDVLEVLCVRIDVDITGPTHKPRPGQADTEEEALEAIGVVVLRPTALVFTGGGYQAWWLLDRPYLVSDSEVVGLVGSFTDAVKLASPYLVDSTSDLTRILRVPGTTNKKAGAPIPAELVAFDATQRYLPSEIRTEVERLSNLADSPPKQRVTCGAARRHRSVQSIDSPDQQIVEGHRNDHLTSIAGTLRRSGCNEATIAAALLSENANRCVPPLGEAEVRVIARSVAVYPPGDTGSSVVRSNVVDLQQAIEEGTRVRCGPDGQLYRYVDGVYRPDGVGYIREKAARLLGRKFTLQQLSTVTTLFQCRPREEFDTDITILNVKNGLLDWSTGELRPHTAEFFTPIRLPVSWNPEASCPAIESFLQQVVPSDAISVVEEFVGECLTGYTGQRKAMMLLGSGSNGKTTLLKLTTAVIGRENCSSIPLQKLCDDRFAAAQLHGKLANIAGDIDHSSPRSVAMFKSITGGDAIYGDIKYGEPFSFVSTAGLLFAANDLPHPPKGDAAYCNRWLIVPFEAAFPHGSANKYLIDELTTSEELEGWLVRIVSALNRLQARGHHEVGRSMSIAHDQFRSHQNHFDRFIAARPQGPGLRITRKALRATYECWCHSDAAQPLTDQAFTNAVKTHLEQAYQGQKVESQSKGVRRWVGIG